MGAGLLPSHLVGLWVFFRSSGSGRDALREYGKEAPPYPACWHAADSRLTGQRKRQFCSESVGSVGSAGSAGCLCTSTVSASWGPKWATCWRRSTWRARLLLQALFGCHSAQPHTSFHHYPSYPRLQMRKLRPRGKTSYFICGAHSK